MVDRERIDELLAMLARYVRILRQLAEVALEPMARMRNRLVHLYEEVNPPACMSCCVPVSVTLIASPALSPST